MSGASKKLMGTTAAAGGGFTAIEDVFSTYLYTGNGSAQVIENGINLGQSFGSGSVKFDAGDTINVSSPISLSGNFTLEAWVYLDKSSYSIIIGNSTLSPNVQFGINVSQQVYIYDGSTELTSTGTITLREWTHVAVSRSGSTLYYFINGTASGTQTSSATLVYQQIGAVADIYNLWNGYLADVRIAGVALYTSSFTAPTSPLTAVAGTSLLACQGGSQFIDNSVNGYTLTAFNTPTASTFGPFDAATPGEGGLVWIKERNNISDHGLFDTERGIDYRLRSNTTNAETLNSGWVTSFNSDGLSVGESNSSSGSTYASWTFRKAPRFFDVVTYTGEPTTSKTISHNLGSVPGMIIVKRTNGVGNWAVYHRSTGETKFLELEDTIAATTNSTYWFNTAPTDTEFTVGSDSAVNTDGGTYVAYLFAHDPLGPSGDGSDGLIACGSYTGDGTIDGSKLVNIGWEPQWLLIKNTSVSENWLIIDNMRGAGYDATEALFANLSQGASTSGRAIWTMDPQGFRLSKNNSDSNESGNNYIYIAIRRGPMRQPESGTEVFASQAYTGDNTFGRYLSGVSFPPDAFWATDRNGYEDWYNFDRLRGDKGRELKFNSTAAEGVYADDVIDSFTMDGIRFDATQSSVLNGSSGINYISYFLRRAPGFFDVVAYTGNGVAGRTVPHNLGVAPELMIVKSRVSTNVWMVYHSALGATKYLQLQSTSAEATGTNAWNDTAPTATDFTVGTWSDVNGAGFNYIAYLFATLPGVSKVGSYTGNGTSQTIDCGFTSGARFVLIRGPVETTGNWWVWDTARGITVGDDKLLSLNTTDAEMTLDSVDPHPSGFTVEPAISSSGGTYIFYAIA